MTTKYRARFAEITAPRLLNEDETAHYLGMSKSSFTRSIDQLEKNNFPRRHPVIRKRDRHAIDIWLDHAYGIMGETELISSQVLERIKKIGDG